MADRLAAVESRLRRFADAGDPSGLTEPGALQDARDVWAAALRSAGGDPREIPVRTVASLAHFDWYASQVRPGEEKEKHRVRSLVLFRLLLGRAADRIPDEALSPKPRSLCAATIPPTRCAGPPTSTSARSRGRVPRTSRLRKKERELAHPGPRSGLNCRPATVFNAGMIRHG